MNTNKGVAFVKEVLGYKIYQKYLPAPEANFMRVEVQGEYLGLYINTETVDKLFLKKHFKEKNGILVKCDPVQRYGIPGPSGRSDLKWLGTDSLLYYNHYEMKSDRGWKAFIHMIDVLNHYPEQIDSVLNVDRILWAFAVNQVISNFDTYNGVDQRNYYMYQTNDGLFQMIPWDVSESFINAMLGDFDDPNDYYQYDPHKGAKSWWYPLCEKLTGDPDSKYGKIYTAHLRTVLEEILDETEILSTIDYLQAVAQDAVNTDPNNIWSNLIFRSNVHADFNAYGYSFAGVMKTVRKRKEYLEIHPELQKEAPVISDVIINKSNNSYYVNSIVSNADDVELMVCSNAYNSKFKSLSMNDDGINGDAMAGDGIYTAPVQLNSDGTDFKFYIRAANGDAIQLSPQRAEYEFYEFSTLTDSELIEENRSLALYPNPTSGRLFFKGHVNGPIKYVLRSSMGKTLKNGVLNSNGSVIDITSFAPGLYFIIIDDKTFKIVKTK